MDGIYAPTWFGAGWARARDNVGLGLATDLAPPDSSRLTHSILQYII